MALLSPVLADSGWIYCQGALVAPNNAMLVRPLYYPDQCGDRLFHGKPYRKFISVGPKPGQVDPSLVFLPKVSSTTYLLPRNEIVRIFDPHAAYTQWKDARDVRRAAIDRILTRACVPRKAIGLIGSKACECTKVGSDIDVIIKGREYVGPVLAELNYVIQSGAAQLMDSAKAKKYAERYGDYYGLDKVHLHELFSTDITKLYVEGAKISFIFAYNDDEESAIPSVLYQSHPDTTKNFRGKIISAYDSWLFPRCYLIETNDGMRYSLWSHEWLYKNFFPEGTVVDITAQVCSDTVLALTNAQHKMMRVNTNSSQ